MTPDSRLVTDFGTDSWARFVDLFRGSGDVLPPPWGELFGPLHAMAADGLMVVGQMGQSLDGRIATPTGHSHYINGPAGLDHLHRLRALMDAVVVGVGTVAADDPQLTVRRVAGPHPVRVVIDPNGRLPRTAKVLAEDGVRRIVVRAEGVRSDFPAGVEVAALPVQDGALAPAAILTALAERGLHRILIEGGADTVSRFLGADLLDRLHVVVAPKILGSGPVGLSLPPIEHCDQARKVAVRVHRLDDEVLFDCDLSAQRARLAGRAKIST